jgi:hypothetical protein
LKPWHSFHGVARGQIQDMAFTVNAQSKTLMAVAALDGSIIIYNLSARSVLTHITNGHSRADGTTLYILVRVAHVFGFRAVLYFCDGCLPGSLPAYLFFSSTELSPVLVCMYITVSRIMCNLCCIARHSQGASQHENKIVTA